MSSLKSSKQLAFHTQALPWTIWPLKDAQALLWFKPSQQNFPKEVRLLRSRPMFWKSSLVWRVVVGLRRATFTLNRNWPTTYHYCNQVQLYQHIYFASLHSRGQLTYVQRWESDTRSAGKRPSNAGGDPTLIVQGKTMRAVEHVPELRLRKTVSCLDYFWRPCFHVFFMFAPARLLFLMCLKHVNSRKRSTQA